MSFVWRRRNFVKLIDLKNDSFKTTLIYTCTVVIKMCQLSARIFITLSYLGMNKNKDTFHLTKATMRLLGSPSLRGHP